MVEIKTEKNYHIDRVYFKTILPENALKAIIQNLKYPLESRNVTIH